MLYTKSLASLSAYKNSARATSQFLAASDLHSFAWFYDVHILCSDCMMMQKKPPYAALLHSSLKDTWIWNKKKKNVVLSVLIINWWDLHKRQTLPLYTNDNAVHQNERKKRWIHSSFVEFLNNHGKDILCYHYEAWASAVYSTGEGLHPSMKYGITWKMGNRKIIDGN